MASGRGSRRCNLLRNVSAGHAQRLRSSFWYRGIRSTRTLKAGNGPRHLQDASSHQAPRERPDNGFIQTIRAMPHSSYLPIKRRETIIGGRTAPRQNAMLAGLPARKAYRFNRVPDSAHDQLLPTAWGAVTAQATHRWQYNRRWNGAMSSRFARIHQSANSGDFLPDPIHRFPAGVRAFPRPSDPFRDNLCANQRIRRFEHLHKKAKHLGEHAIPWVSARNEMFCPIRRE